MDEFLSLPTVDYADLESNREKFLGDLRRALGEVGFLILKNAPGFEDDVQKRLFGVVREFFDAPIEVKQKADIRLSPYFRGWSRKTPGDSGFTQVLEAFQYGFECQPVCDPHDERAPIHERVFRGPNTWPDHEDLPKFRSTIQELTRKYHDLTHVLGYLICESLGVAKEEFERYFDKEDPDLAASLNHNYSLAEIDPDLHEHVKDAYSDFESPVTGAHIDGPPFIALLINDRPGLQVVGKDGKWINAPVTCRTKEGDYQVPVCPGSVIVNTGGTLMHLSKGRYAATLHRVDTQLIPLGDTRISMPFFLLPKMEGALEPFKVQDGHDTGYKQERNRGINAAVNRMNTFPQVTRRWWKKEFKELSHIQRAEVEAETSAAYKLAKLRAEPRMKSNL